MNCECKSYTVGSALIRCDVTDPANPADVLWHPVYDANGHIIPDGSTVIAAEDADSKGSDGSGFVRSYATDLAGVVLDPATYTLGSCTKPSTDVEFGEFVDPDDPKAGAVRVYSVVEVDAGGVPTKVWYRADDDSVYTPAATEVFVSEGDWESRPVCVYDTGAGARRQVTGVTVDEHDEVLYDSAGVTVLTATEVIVPCDAESERVTGCATFADGTRATITRILPVVAGVPDHGNEVRVNPIDGLATVADVDGSGPIDLTAAVLTEFCAGSNCCPTPTTI